MTDEIQPAAPAPAPQPAPNAPQPAASTAAEPAAPAAAPAPAAVAANAPSPQVGDVVAGGVIFGVRRFAEGGVEISFNGIEWQAAS